MKPGDLAERVLSGDRRAVARAISLVEDGSAELPALSKALYPRTGRAHTVGLTGSPGVGKSSLAEQLVRAARTREKTVAVLAIDPTSPFTGGALLGDRLRMQAHATDPGVFIRSMATRGHLGGMALAAPEALRILDASGKDLIILETVGVGQAEVEVATAADTTLVVVAPGWGDAVQVSKAGILEIADVFVVNKSDREGADDAVRDLRNMLRMGPKTEWVPPIVRTSTVTGEGIDELWDAIERHRKQGDASGELEARRNRRVRAEVQSMVAFRLGQRAAALLENDAAEGSLTADLASRRVDPYRAAEILLQKVLTHTGE
ncbi:MAG TPA: methylmalonyl Co-A mutase-associated GTPase MeaB, partial [Actinomycetota bacterium]|nr:methylmalonyl Co-A mutase-associated GTPase MeaB [Actinomycetota bacterium]